jgi:hypothetical protein
MILRLTKNENGILGLTEPVNYEQKVEMLQSFIKQPAEILPVTIDFTTRLPSGATISSATLSAIDLSDNSSVSATIWVSTTGSVSGAKVTGKARNGTTEKIYKLTFTLTLSDGSVLEEDLEMNVIAE